LDSRHWSDPFAELFGDLADRLRGDRFQPAMDVFETDSALVVRFELAGVRGGDLRVTVDADLVRVSGVRKPPPSDGAQRLHQMEIGFGPFERSLRLPVDVDRDAVTANLEEGILTVTLPKRQRVRRRVEVET
jgi:HSP20 family protein